MSPNRVTIGAVLAATYAMTSCLPGRSLLAQSPQKVSVQASAFSTLISANGERAVGGGFEPQLRVNGPLVGATGVVSIGVGGQVTRHNLRDGGLTLLGAFIEPRVAFGNSRLRLPWYWSARVAVLRQQSEAASTTNGFALGIGSGVVKSIGSDDRTNLDLGLGVALQDFADARTSSGRLYRFSGAVGFFARVGVNVGLGR